MTGHDPEQGCGILVIALAILAVGLVVAVASWLATT